jgi:hypothetical protein
VTLANDAVFNSKSSSWMASLYSPKSESGELFRGGAKHIRTLFLNAKIFAEIGKFINL